MCKVNSHSEGMRAGYNLFPSYAETCTVEWGHEGDRNPLSIAYVTEPFKAPLHPTSLNSVPPAAEGDPDGLGSSQDNVVLIVKKMGFRTNADPMLATCRANRLIAEIVC